MAAANSPAGAKFQVDNINLKAGQGGLPTLEQLRAELDGLSGQINCLRALATTLDAEMQSALARQATLEAVFAHVAGPMLAAFTSDRPALSIIPGDGTETSAPERAHLTDVSLRR